MHSNGNALARVAGLFSCKIICYCIPMRCPKCKKINNQTATVCKHCGVRFVRKSDRIVRQLTINGRISMACGGLLMLMAVAALLAGAYPLGLFLAVIGATFTGIGKMMG